MTNEKLQGAAFSGLAQMMIENDPIFAMLAETPELGAGILQGTLETKVDIEEPSKFRMRVSLPSEYLIVYAYDFGHEHRGQPGETAFNTAVENTKTYGGRPGTETFIKEMIIQDRYGVYITRLE